MIKLTAVSHIAERKEKNCLNCGATVAGRYCQVCGQENTEPKETTWHLINHFFSDVTHFDGKFFVSMKDLVLRPGFLSRQYTSGKRASYLNPIRMYLFTSFIFFLIFFSVYKIDTIANVKIENGDLSKEDTVLLRQLSGNVNKGAPLTRKDLQNRLDTTHITFAGSQYASKEQYDSLLKNGAVKDGWFKRMITYKGIELAKKYHNNNSLAIKNLLERVQHFIPQMLFILLPLFALLLQLLNMRHKNFYYTDHAIFTIHFYIFLFMAMLLIFGVSRLEAATGAGWLQWVRVALFLVIFFYFYKAMRNFYGQSRFKTVAKFSIVLVSFVIIGFFVTSLFFFISVFEI